ncbi:hypothetical protein A471_04600 [Ectopseudomonas mendocina DLHK]|nr:hypothetical protein A471_04600 [Pseudomonas mendocina DLHK]
MRSIALLTLSTLGLLLFNGVVTMNTLLILTELLDGIERALRAIFCRGNHAGGPQKHDKEKLGKTFICTSD